jgi:hypothetical protein
LARDDSIGRVIDEIGTGKVCFTQSNVEDLRNTLLEKGYDAAEAQATQYMGTDAYSDLLRVMQILRKHNLSPEAGADVLKNIIQIREGHW